MIRKVLTVAIGALVALSVGAAGAYFTEQLQVPDSVIHAGTVELSTEPTSAPLSIPVLAPGRTVSRVMRVANDGTLPSDVIITATKKAGITEFYEAIACHVTCNGSYVYDGPLSQLKTSKVRLDPGAVGEYRFDVRLASAAGDNLQGDYARVSLYVDAEQTH